MAPPNGCTAASARRAKPASNGSCTSGRPLASSTTLAPLEVSANRTPGICINASGTPAALRPVAGSTSMPRASAARIAASVRGLMRFSSSKTVPSRSRAIRRIIRHRGDLLVGEILASYTRSIARFSSFCKETLPRQGQKAPAPVGVCSQGCGGFLQQGGGGYAWVAAGSFFAWK